MRIIVAGGGAAGASCAARLRRLNEQAEIIILEKTDEISIANCGLPYYCSDVISDREKMLVSNPSVFKNLLNVEVRLNSELTIINREEKVVTVNNDYKLEYDKLVLALGATPLKPPISGIDNPKIFTVRTLADADKIKDFVRNNKVENAVVVGGGFIGVEMAENFVHLGLNASIVELSNQLLAPIDLDMAAFVHNQARDNGVNLILSDGIKAFESDEILLNSGTKIPYDIAILSIGVKPETVVAKDAGLVVGSRGGILVNEFMQTNDENIYAAGDSVEIKDFVDNSVTLIPLAGPANRQGRIIADNISGVKSTYKNTQGTAVVKIFDLTVANTGNNEKLLKAKSVEYKKVHVLGNSHATYYPGSFPMFIKFLFNDAGEILGAQAVGVEGVEKRIDVIASVMRLNGKVQDLIDSELSYAPPYSSAKDPVNILGMAADNILKGFVKPIYADEIEDAYLIDVRKPEEFAFKTIAGAVNISAETIRDNLSLVPKDKKVVLFCNRGFQSYVASRVLTQNGFDNVYSLSGGFSFYKEQLKNNIGKVESRVPVKAAVASKSDVVIKLDACGMQCPGPILKLSEAIKKLNDSEVIEISTTDSGFMSDIKGWCSTTNNTLLDLKKENLVITAKIQKGSATMQDNVQETKNGQTIVVFSDDFDKVLASFVIANGAAASGKPVTLFFTFWGLNVLRKCNFKEKNKCIIGKMFDFMLPKCVENLPLSKMNMGGLGSLMMKKIMKNKNIFSLKELIQSAQENGVKFIACSMSMDVMGIKQEEFIDGVEIGGVANYIAEANGANSNLFI